MSIKQGEKERKRGLKPLGEQGIPRNNGNIHHPGMYTPYPTRVCTPPYPTRVCTTGIHHPGMHHWLYTTRVIPPVLYQHPGYTSGSLPTPGYSLGYTPPGYSLGYTPPGLYLSYTTLGIPLLQHADLYHAAALTGNDAQK